MSLVKIDSVLPSADRVTSYPVGDKDFVNPVQVLPKLFVTVGATCDMS